MPTQAGVPTKIQAKYREPMAVTKVLPNDNYVAAEILRIDILIVGVNC